MSLTPPPIREPWLLDHVGRLRSMSWIQWFERLVSFDIIDTVYPVGYIYISVSPTSPADLFKRGTWVVFGAGRTLVSLDATDTDFDTVEETRGAKTATPSAHAGTAVASHAAHTHSTPALSHGAITGATAAASAGSGSSGADPSTLTVAAHTHAPGTLAVPQHAAGTTGDPSATLSHSVTQPSNHAAMSVLQPVIVVYMWKRTA